MAAQTIPRFFLYGEAPRVVDRFLNIEALDERTRPANWNIRPHSHANLNHLFHISEGGGVMKADDRRLPFKAPCLLLVPSKIVHGFEYETDTKGTVVTVSDTYLQELLRRETHFERLFAVASAINPANPEVVLDGMSRLAREMTWTAPGHATAVEALLVTLLVECLRATHMAETEPRLAHGAQAALVARFRAQVEADYRHETRVEAFAERLGVSPKRLRAACLQIAGAPPLRIIQDRLALEAKRLMLYSNMTVAEAGYYLGFDDPAYFSRFFTRAAGVSPRKFRTGREAGLSAA